MGLSLAALELFPINRFPRTVFPEQKVWRGLPAAFFPNILRRARGMDTSVVDQEMSLFIPISICVSRILSEVKVKEGQ